MDDQTRNKEEPNEETDGGNTRLHHQDYTGSREAWKRYLSGEITATELESIVGELGKIKEDLYGENGG